MSTLPLCVKWEGHDYPNGITCRSCWTYWNDQRNALFAADPSAWAPVPRPICVEWERHYPGRTTCNHCMPYWSAMAERHAPREACGSVHAHEAHVWWPWAEIRAERWCLGVEQCPPSDAGRVALTMTVDAGRMFWQALIYAAARVSPDARVAGAEQSHEEWLQWGASRLDAAIRAADAGEAGQP